MNRIALIRLGFFLSLLPFTISIKAQKGVEDFASLHMK